MTTVRTGDTVRLTVTFKDWTDQAADVESPTLKVYDRARQVLTTVTLVEANRTGTGQYYYDYLVPDVSGKLTYEFSGTSQGTVTLVRDELEAVFVPTA